MAETKALGHVVVTGGSGFLGNHIVKLLKERKVCSKLTVHDLRQPKDVVPGVEYAFADLTNYDEVVALFQKLRPDVVIHTASPPSFLHSDVIFYKVNVEGTKNMVRASQETGVKAFVYTSSASIIHDTISDLINADETYPLIMGKDQPQYYSTTKAEAEIFVLAENRTKAYPNFLTVSVRPSGIFGEGDTTAVPPMCTAYYQGQTKFQLGDDENLFDWTEVTNVAHAHHLAAAALLITHERISKGQAPPLDHEKVDGEAFLITNDTPTYFWNLPRSLWRELGHQGRAGEAWILSRSTAIALAVVLEWIFWLMRKEPNLTRQRVTYACTTRYFNIDKAKRRLGYKPVVSIEEGVKRAARDSIYRGVVKGQPKELAGNPEVLKNGVVAALAQLRSK